MKKSSLFAFDSGSRPDSLVVRSQDRRSGRWTQVHPTVGAEHWLQPWETLQQGG